MPLQSRDLRLDFFRGLALLMIFVNHIPFNPLGEITPRNFGFSDATEIFIFLSGYAAAMTYGRVYEQQGYGVTVARILKRVWQLFVAHLFMLVVFCGVVAISAELTGNQTYIQEMYIGPILSDPGHALAFAPLLGFQPAFMNILPMYIALMLMFIPMIAVLRASRPAFIAVALSVYAVATIANVNLPVYPRGVWYFNPFAWQALFMMGALFGYKPARAGSWIPQGRAPLIAAVSYLTFSLIFVLSWTHPALNALIPAAVKEMVYPLSKTNLSIWRFLHFFATAYVAIRLVPAGAAWLRDRAAGPILVCGRHALEVFCLGILLSFAGRVVMIDYERSFASIALVNGIGMALLVALAAMLDWYKAGARLKPQAVRAEAPARAAAEPARAPAALEPLSWPAAQRQAPEVS